MRDFTLRLISTGVFLATHINAHYFNHVNKIEARFKVLRLNMRLGEVLLLPLRATFHTQFACILLVNINFMHVLTEKLRNSGNQPLVRNTFCC